MTETCSEGDHIAGTIANRPVRMSDWADAKAAFDAVVEDFNTRGQREQINHPGWVVEASFCPECGAKIDESVFSRERQR